jgi:pimeloyl-ACP methyl ester carboxylesterase
MRLTVRTHGPLEAQPMVLLHGLTSDGSSFDGVVDALAQRWRIYVPDQRGHGTTGPADAYAFELLAADLDEFLEERGLTTPVLIGHSMGAVAAYLHAARRPDRTGPLVLVEPPPPFPQRRPVPERPDGPLGYEWAARVALVGQVNEPGPSWLGELAEIRVPTLVVGGGPTSPFPQDQMRAMADRIPSGSFQEIPVGHGVHREAPTAFLAAVTTFLDTAS